MSSAAGGSEWATIDAEAPHGQMSSADRVRADRQERRLGRTSPDRTSVARHRASDARRSTNPTRAIADDRDPRSRFDGGLAVGVVSGAAVEVAAGGGSAIAAGLLAVELVRDPRQLLPSAAPSSRGDGRDDGDDRDARDQ